jgi:hypothetical protein
VQRRAPCPCEGMARDLHPVSTLESFEFEKLDVLERGWSEVCAMQLWSSGEPVLTLDRAWVL